MGNYFFPPTSFCIKRPFFFLRCLCTSNVSDHSGYDYLIGHYPKQFSAGFPKAHSNVGKPGYSSLSWSFFSSIFSFKMHYKYWSLWYLTTLRNFGVIFIHFFIGISFVYLCLDIGLGLLSQINQAPNKTYQSYGVDRLTILN